jgi:hypothetical protein
MRYQRIPRNRLILGAIMLGLAGLVVALWVIRLKGRKQPTEILELIEQLREPTNSARVVLYMVPGGEILEYSAPMNELIALGDAAREPLHQRIGDEQIQNEVVLILGAIGDDNTVPLLIDAYPELDLPDKPADTWPPDAARLKLICFSHALTYLTHEGISRSRWARTSRQRIVRSGRIGGPRTTRCFGSPANPVSRLLSLATLRLRVP